MTHQLDIPLAGLRELIFIRQYGLCARCGGPMRFDDFEAHHRRRRNVLGWCPCNIVALHPRCHTQGPLAVHDHVEQSRLIGLIVPTFGAEPFDVELQLHTQTPAGSVERVLLSCDGLVTYLDR